MSIGATIGISMLSALVSAYFTYLFSFRQYLKQKTREEIRRYYIENGINRIIEDLDNACFACQFNFAKAIRIIEYLEKTPETFKVNEKIIRKIFSEMQPAIVAPSNALYKLQLLTGEEYKLLTSWVINALADYLRYNDYLRHELALEVEIFLQYPEKIWKQKEKFFNELRSRINEIYNKIIPKHEPLKTHLLNLKIRIDELGISTLKDFDEKVFKDKRVKEILRGVERDYKKIESKDNCEKKTGKIYKERGEVVIKPTISAKVGLKRGDITWTFFPLAYSIILTLITAVISLLENFSYVWRISMILCLAVLFFYLCFFNDKVRDAIVKFFIKSKEHIER